LRNWVKRLQDNADEVRKIVSEETYRIWLLYMAGSAAAFHRGEIAVYQTLLSRPDRGLSGLPLTRRDWYLPLK
jgi:cyclopropane-fatty-acyl-phospholipid synthase